MRSNDDIRTIFPEYSQIPNSASLIADIRKLSLKFNLHQFLDAVMIKKNLFNVFAVKFATKYLTKEFCIFDKLLINDHSTFSHCFQPHPHWLIVDETFA